MSDCRKSGRLKQCYPRTGRGDGDTLIRSLIFWTARHRHSLSSNTRALYTHAHIIEDSEILLRSQVVSPHDKRHARILHDVAGAGAR